MFTKMIGSALFKPVIAGILIALLTSGIYIVYNKIKESGALELQVSVQQSTIDSYKLTITALQDDAKRKQLMDVDREKQLEQLIQKERTDTLALIELNEKLAAAGDTCVNAFHPKSISDFLRYGGQIVTRSDGTSYTPIKVPSPKMVPRDSKPDIRGKDMGRYPGIYKVLTSYK